MSAPVLTHELAQQRSVAFNFQSPGKTAPRIQYRSHIAYRANGASIDAANNITGTQSELCCRRTGIDLDNGYPLAIAFETQFCSRRRRKFKHGRPRKGIVPLDDLQ